MASDRTLLVVAIIAVVVSAVGLILVWSNVFTFERILLSPSDTGVATVTVANDVSIHFAKALVSWGSGTVTPSTIVTLDTEGTVTNFVGSGVLPVSYGLIVENIGNVPALIDIAADSDAATFLGGTAPTYKYKVGNCFDGSNYVCDPAPVVPGLLDSTQDSDVAGACGSSLRDPTLVGMWTGYVDMPVSPITNRICGIPGTGGMDFAPANDEIEIDIQLTFASDVSIGQKQSTITVTASSAV